MLESEVSQQIYALAKEKLGIRRHWHKRIVRAGPNSVIIPQSNVALVT